MLKTLGLTKAGKVAELYGIFGFSVEDSKACSHDNIGKMQQRISDLDIKISALFTKLGFEYQTSCKENLPKVIKKTHKK